jgi:hypothetical protein
MSLLKELNQIIRLRAIDIWFLNEPRLQSVKTVT